MMIEGAGERHYKPSREEGATNGTTIESAETVTILPATRDDAELLYSFLNDEKIVSKTSFDELTHVGAIREIDAEQLKERFFANIDDIKKQILLIARTRNNMTCGFGYATLNISEPSRPSDQLEFMICVADEFKKRGIGRKILEGIIALAKKNGFSGIYGDCSEEMKMSIISYNKRHPEKPFLIDPTYKNGFSLTFELEGPEDKKEAQNHTPQS